MRCLLPKPSKRPKWKQNWSCQELVKMWRDGKCRPWLQEFKSVSQLGKTVWLSIYISYGFILPILCIQPTKNVHACAPKDIYESVHSSAILRPRMETSWMSNSYFCFEKLVLWYICIMKDLQQWRTTDDCFIQQQMNLRDMSWGKEARLKKL